MGISRYMFAKKSSDNVGPSSASYMIRNAVKSGVLKVHTLTMKSGERLDQIASREYGDASYWWVIAAASGIGWGMQVPPGTLIRVPKDLSQVMSLMV
tara:strand:+ start:471 stop:761 length:291 start_codon:yes stop_codon:yes gene_type:complete